MKTVLVLAASMSLFASAALAECGHDRTAQSKSTTVAALDTTTTASTTAIDRTQAETVLPAEE